MSDYLLKSLIAVVFLGTIVTSFLSMMTLMGRVSHKATPERLRKIHKWSGIVALVLLAPLVYLGADFLSEIGEGLTVRAVFHFVLAALLLSLIILKVMVVWFYKPLMKYAMGLGMAIFAITIVIFVITAGYFFLLRGIP